MISPKYCQSMASYNEWMNGKIYRLCDRLTEDELRVDRGLFFNSIYMTLNHIMYGDLALISRLSEDFGPSPKLNDDLYGSFSELHKARTQLDTNIVKWTETLTSDFLEKNLTYISNVDSITRELPNWLYLSHLFNHQTHHRGQISTALHQIGIDIGPTDITALLATAKLS